MGTVHVLPGSEGREPFPRGTYGDLPEGVVSIRSRCPPRREPEPFSPEAYLLAALVEAIRDDGRRGEAVVRSAIKSMLKAMRQHKDDPVVRVSIKAAINLCGACERGRY